MCDGNTNNIANNKRQKKSYKSINKTIEILLKDKNTMKLQSRKYSFGAVLMLYYMCAWKSLYIRVRDAVIINKLDIYFNKINGILWKGNFCRDKQQWEMFYMWWTNYTSSVVVHDHNLGHFAFIPNANTGNVSHFQEESSAVLNTAFKSCKQNERWCQSNFGQRVKVAFIRHCSVLHRSGHLKMNKGIFSRKWNTTK